MKLLSKDSRIASSLSEQGKREHLFYTVLSAILFVAASFTMWEFLYALCNMIGAMVCADPEYALRELLRMLPQILFNFTLVFMLGYEVNAFRARKEGQRARIWKRDGIATIVMGVVIIVYIIVSLVTGRYGSIVEGYPSALFPLDLIIAGAGLCVYGVFSFKYGKKLEKDGSALPLFYDKRPFFVRGIDSFFGSILIMIELCAFAAAVTGLWVIDFAHGAVFYSIMVWLVYALAAFWLIVYRGVYDELKDECRRKGRLVLGLSAFGINLVVFALYMVSVQIYNEAPNLNAYGVLPIDFSASFNAFMVVFALNNVVAPLIFTVRGLFGGKKA